MKLEKILQKWGIKGLKVQKNKVTKSKNNQSREVFVKFCKDNGFERVGAANAFVYKGAIYGFSLVSDHPECRQFGEHYKGLACKLPNGELRWFEKDQIKFGSVSRIGPDGVKYFNAHA